MLRRVGMGKLKEFAEQAVLICGDIIADVYEYGIIRRMSREAPIPIVEFESEQVIPGGAGNVAANIRSLHGEAYPISVLGQDQSGQAVLKELERTGVRTEGLLCSPELSTTTKRRVLAHGEHTVRQQIMRLDRVPGAVLPEKTLALLWDRALQVLPEASAVVISDYHLLVIPERFFLDLLQLAKKKRKIVVVDSRRRILQYKGVTMLTPNRAEVEAVIGQDVRTVEDLKKAGEIIIGQTEAETLLITLGEDGMALINRDKEVELIPAHNRLEVFDVSGAGDTVVAAVTLGLGAGMTPSAAARLANIAAGLVVRKLGTATVDLAEVEEVLENDPGYRGKVYDRAELQGSYY